MTFGMGVYCASLLFDQVSLLRADAQGFDAFMTALHIAIWFDDVGSIPLDYYKNYDHVDAAELYPDLKYSTVEDFYISTI